MKRDEWVGDDNFDYGRAVATAPQMPPTLHLVGKKDTYLGHPFDVQRFIAELKGPAQLVMLSKQTGFKHDYDHINTLTHEAAQAEIFPMVLSWLKEPGKSPNKK